MKLRLQSYSARHQQGGWALLAVMTLSICGLLVLASVMNWANSNADVTARNNEYWATTYAAEAATEKVLTHLSTDYQDYQFSLVAANLSSYSTNIPTSSDSPYWNSYQFSGGSTTGQVIVTNTVTSSQIVLGAPYTGLNLSANTYEIIANAQNTTTMYKLVSTVGQQIYLGTIPLFQFAIFYQGDMEIEPGAPMTITGPVHGNANGYFLPQDGLSLQNTSFVGTNYTNQSPNDSTHNGETASGLTFATNAYDLNGVNPLNLPVGTGLASSNSQSVYGILVPPTAGEGPNTTVGTNLLYNKADMIIMISNNNQIYVTSGAGINNQATAITNYSSFLSTNGTFYDQRDQLTVDQVVLNVSNLVQWSATNNTLRPVLQSARGSSAADVESIYIDDMRSTSNLVVSTNTSTSTNYSTNSTTTASYPAAGTYSPPVTTNVTSLTTNTTYSNSTTKPAAGTYTGSYTQSGGKYYYYKITGYTTNYNYTYGLITSSTSTSTNYSTNWSTPTVQPGIVLSNGAYLPPNGLSIATPDPAYIIGNWNVQTAKGGTSDAGTNDVTYTLPSAVYADAITVLSSAWNPANSTAILSSRTAASDTVTAAFLTGNVPSANGAYSGGVENFPRFLENWGGQTFTYNGSMVAMFASQIATAPWPNTGTVYSPPTRHWAFDVNFNNPAKQPPMTPQVISVQRSKWVVLAPYATSF